MELSLVPGLSSPAGVYHFLYVREYNMCLKHYSIFAAIYLGTIWCGYLHFAGQESRT